MPQTISSSATNRAAIKARILELNRQAQDADTRMRDALKANNQAVATTWRERRDAYNAESKRLAESLMQTDAELAMTPDEIKKRLTELPYKIQYANKMLAEYQRVNNAAKINEWALELRNLEAEQARLSARLGTAPPAVTPTPVTPTPVTPRPTPVTPTPVTPAPTPVAPPVTGESNFISTVADTFNTTGNQDYAHNAILTGLLGSRYSKANIPANDSKAAAYNIARDNNSAPVNWIRNQAQSQALHDSLPVVGDLEKRRFPRLNLNGLRAGQTFFIRDFMQVNSPGNLTIANLMVVDDTVYSGFAQDFDFLVNGINEYQKQRGRTYRVLPYLRMAHRDAIQLIPGTADGINQFGGAVMNNVSVSGNLIYSDGALQGIFASDGAFRNLHIRSNHLQIGGEHTITIAGMLSGSVMGNTDINNNPLADSKIALYPLRLGGGANISIIGFSNKASVSAADPRYYRYETILGVPPARDFRQQVMPRSLCYSNVDMVELHALFKRQNPQTPAQWQTLMAELVRKGFAKQVTN